MAAAMQGIQSPPGTSPVSPRKADSTAAHSRVTPPVTALEKRGASAGGEQQHRKTLGKGGVQPGDIRQRGHEPSPPM